MYIRQFSWNRYSVLVGLAWPIVRMQMSIGKDHITDQSRLIFSMPAKYGGIGFLDPSSVSELEYESSLQATSQLTDAIFQQQMTLRIDDEAQSKTIKEIKHKKYVWFQVQGTPKQD